MGTDSPGPRQLLDQPQPPPALGVWIGEDLPQQPWAAIAHRDEQPVPAQLHHGGIGRRELPAVAALPDKARAAAAAARVGASRSSSCRYGGRAATASTASSTLAYSRKKSGTSSRFRTLATRGWAAHSCKLVVGQRLAGWLATVEKTLAHTRSSAWTRVRSQIRASGCSLRPLSRARWTWETVNRLMLPVKARTRQPSRVERWISMAHPRWWPTAGPGLRHQRSAWASHSSK
jgi:hypothetical protein